MLAALAAGVALSGWSDAAHAQQVAAGMLATALTTLGIAALSVGIEQDVGAVVVAAPLTAAVTSILVEQRTAQRR